MQIRDDEPKSGRIHTKLRVRKELAFFKRGSILLLWVWVPGLGWA